MSEKGKSLLPSDAEWQNMDVCERFIAGQAALGYCMLVSEARISGRKDISKAIVEKVNNEEFTQFYNHLDSAITPLYTDIKFVNQELKETFGGNFFEKAAEYSYPVYVGTCKDMGIKNIPSYNDYVNKGIAIDNKIKQIKPAMKNKIKEEILQYQSMGGIGEYLAHNAMTVLTKAARGVGAETLAQNIEAKRENAFALGKAFDDKIKEEKAQFKSMGGIGEYLTQNILSLDDKISKMMGKPTYTQATHEAFINMGKAFDDKVKEEWAQFKSMGGIGEYLAQNVTTVLVQASRDLGDELAAQDIEAQRENALALGKAFDNKVKEEWAQYQSMGGFGEYLAQNTSTLMSDLAKNFGQDQLAEKIETQREDFIANGKAFDSKFKEYMQPCQQEIKELTEYFSSSAKSKENPYDYIEQKNPVQNATMQLKDSASGNKKLVPVYTYQQAEIKHLEQNDGSFVEVAMIDGKKHGAEIAYNADKSIQNIKLYNHGKEINLAKCQVEVKQEKKDGLNYQYVLLDGKKFGMETVSDDKKQNLTVMFHDKDNIMYRGANAQITYTNQDNREILAQYLAKQKGEVKDNPIATSQGIRIDKQQSKKNQTSKKVTTKIKPQSNQKVALASLKKNNEMSN